MINSNTDFKIFLLNAIDYLMFGFGLARRGVCDKRIKGEYKLIEICENHGYTKEEASKLLGLSTRQFDRRIRKGFLPKGHKYQGSTNLYWDKDYIDKMSNSQKS